MRTFEAGSLAMTERSSQTVATVVPNVGVVVMGFLNGGQRNQAVLRNRVSSRV